MWVKFFAWIDRLLCAHKWQFANICDKSAYDWNNIYEHKITVTYICTHCGRMKVMKYKIKAHKERLSSDELENFIQEI